MTNSWLNDVSLSAFLFPEYRTRELYLMDHLV
jgi:hypothetical protein